MAPAHRFALDKVFEESYASTTSTNINSLKRELGRLDTMIAHLIDAVESGTAAAPLVKKLNDRHAEWEALLGAIVAAEAAGRSVPNRQAIERKVQSKVKRVSGSELSAPSTSALRWTGL